MTRILLLIGILSLSSACGSSPDIEETGQQIGDVMASIDESGGSSGSLAFHIQNSSQNLFARVSPSDIHDSWIGNMIFPNAYATSCFLASTFGACTNNVITRNFSGCTIGSATFTGTVTFTFNDLAVDGTCQMTAIGHSITRSPNFTVTGRRGATLSVTKSGTNGQTITKAAGSAFTFTNDGIRRVFRDSSGTALFDFTTQTTSGITITGTSRSGRTLNGGTLRVTNNLSDVSCDYSPSNLTWTTTCNCPTSGSWSGSCTDGKTSSLNITGCGTAKLTIGGDEEDFTFDRCYGT